jgi:hypothetical protein
MELPALGGIGRSGELQGRGTPPRSALSLGLAVEPVSRGQIRNPVTTGERTLAHREGRGRGEDPSLSSSPWICRDLADARVLHHYHAGARLFAGDAIVPTLSRDSDAQVQ